MGGIFNLFVLFPNIFDVSDYFLYAYILYMRREGIALLILHMSLTIYTSTAGDLLMLYNINYS